MPKLPVLTSKRVIQILKRNGFLLERTHGSHFVFYNPGTNRHAVVPSHPKDLPKGTLLEILRQAGFSKDDLLKIL